MASHQLVRALAGQLAGGDPTFVTTLDVDGYWSGMRNAGVLAFAAAGSVTQALLALTGWLAYRRGVGRPGTGSVVGWAFFVVNAWMPAVYLAVSPALGRGEWMPLVDRFAHVGPVRASATVTGLFIAGQLWRATSDSLARLVGNGSGSTRVRRARRIAVVSWAVSGTVALAAAALHPMGPGRALTLATGATLGSTWPVLLAAPRVREAPVPGAPLAMTRSVPLVVAGAVATLLFIAVLGPGIRLD